MAHDQNPHDIVSDTKQEMIRESLPVHAAEITLGIVKDSGLSAASCM